MSSKELYERAKHTIPGGVNSPVRAFNAVGGTPLFIAKGEGALIYDVDNKGYIDYVGSWGPLILGHAHPVVIKKVQETLVKGLSFGAPTELEIKLAEKITEMMPNIEMVRMVNSGTEATMSAIRLARGYTGKNKIIKFEGCYHGHSDALLVKAGSGALTFGVPSSPGVPASFTEHTLVATYNDIDSVEQLFKQHQGDIAAIILEPVAGNMNCIPPLPGFLSALRALCDQYQSLLIFDEVMTGFRVHFGGAQALYNIKPDLTTLGKIVGGGMPVGAFGGRRDIMQQLAPMGPVYQAGTLSGNPVAMAAGLATLEWLEKNDCYPSLASATEQLVKGIVLRAQSANIAMTYNKVGSMFGLFFTTEETITHYRQVINSNVEQFKQFFHLMLEHGVYLAPSAFEAGFVSIAHGPTEVEKTLLAAEKVFSLMNKN